MRRVHSNSFLFLCPTRGLDLGLLDAVLGRRHGFVPKAASRAT